MDGLEKNLSRLLLAADGIAVFLSMVAGPLNHTSVAIGSALSAEVISLCLLGYGLYVWPRRL